MLFFEGAWYRFAQDGLQNYGNNLRAMRILRLNDEEYEEMEIDSGPILAASTKGWNALGMHHLDAVKIGDGQWLGAVDGVTIGI